MILMDGMYLAFSLCNVSNVQNMAGIFSKQEKIRHVRRDHLQRLVQKQELVCFAATLIQWQVRRDQTQVRYQRLRWAVVVMQDHWRGYLVRMTLLLIASAVVLQDLWRAAREPRKQEEAENSFS